MQIFLTGASGYIGGSIATALIAAGHDVHGLVRSAEKAHAVEGFGIKPVHGTLDDVETLADAARAAEAVVHTASADHEACARAMLGALDGSGKPFVHTSGSSIVGTPAGGHLVEDVFEDDTPFTPSPGRAARTALTRDIQRTQGVRVAVIAPSLIYGPGRGAGAHSMQVPWLLETAQRHVVPKHLGPGENRWANVFIDDLVDLYLRVLDRAPPASFYWAENGENSMKELCQAISRMMGQEGRTQEMTPDEAAAEWGEGPAINTMGSNSRVRAVRARRELGWSPSGPGVIDEIETGCYRSGH